jgi:hypothetical protein
MWNLFKWLDMMWDAFIIIMSLADIIFDMLVAKEYYDAGRYDFFVGSMVIFLMAQSAYRSFSFP